eukprot:c2565_g1_i1.p1 GENE.c2565_g1_i1~~c2565_g1_i1.p1  ORF type:complete len:188 (-),score=25.77 c2565_g1_i1:369-932(-)
MLLPEEERFSRRRGAENVMQSFYLTKILPLVIIVFILWAVMMSMGTSHQDDSQFETKSKTAKAFEYKDPPTRKQLGNSAWTLLHTVAATTPLEPDADHQEYLINFVYSFINLFPCEQCRAHAQVNLANFPPDQHVTDRDSFVQWACRFHNVVNEQLGKAQFDCARVDDRWGGCGCDMDGKKPSVAHV